MGRLNWHSAELGQTVDRRAGFRRAMWALSALSAVLLAACAPRAVAPPVDHFAETPTIEVMRSEEKTPTTAVEAPTLLPPTPTVVVGPGGQYATDPASVNLASGRPTLVKFFAFW